MKSDDTEALERVKRARDDKARARAEKLRHWRTSEKLEPVHWRAQHDPIEAGEAITESPHQITDAKGKIAAPLVAHDTIGRMLQSGRITKSEHDSARQFQEDFALAALDPLRAQALIRAAGGVMADEPAGTATERARRRIRSALTALGGTDASLAAKAAWSVLGFQQSLREWCKSLGTRSLDTSGASGVLASAVSLLDLHYNGGLPSRSAAGLSISCNEDFREKRKGGRGGNRAEPPANALPHPHIPTPSTLNAPGSAIARHEEILAVHPEYRSGVKG